MRTLNTFAAFGYLEQVPWLMSGALYVGVFLYFIVVFLIVWYLMIRLSSVVLTYILRQGVSMFLLMLGLGAFFIARVLGIKAAIIGTP
jgi:hypothetical protein